MTPEQKAKSSLFEIHKLSSIEMLPNCMGLRRKPSTSKKYLAPSIYSYPYWRLKSNIRFYKGVFCLFGHPRFVYNRKPVP